MHQLSDVQVWLYLEFIEKKEHFKIIKTISTLWNLKLFCFNLFMMGTVEVVASKERKVNNIMVSVLVNYWLKH